ncbi:hypothetical protein K4L44_04760 [Halosquirtibacter laminarini]|uniref:Uncharacterized protein n=1 Tax=Halosquirtibacter laminarini TaxID=3374600 RepID=A0AC61NHL6_9BACT|nr:hypothetical protein K4L44_04760 [Prolixibacteraceae bacterium]
MLHIQYVSLKDAMLSETAFSMLMFSNDYSEENSSGVLVDYDMGFLFYSGDGIVVKHYSIDEFETSKIRFVEGDYEAFVDDPSLTKAAVEAQKKQLIDKVRNSKASQNFMEMMFDSKGYYIFNFSGTASTRQEMVRISDPKYYISF